jgi:hypothetical protein
MKRNIGSFEVASISHIDCFMNLNSGDDLLKLKALVTFLAIADLLIPKRCAELTQLHNLYSSPSVIRIIRTLR